LKSKLKTAQQQTLSMFIRFFQGFVDHPIEKDYDVSEQDIDWVIENKQKFELENVAILLAHEYVRPVFLLWQIGERREQIKVKTLSKRRSIMLSPSEI
jgi:hypothetical protein